MNVLESRIPRNYKEAVDFIGECYQTKGIRNADVANKLNSLGIKFKNGKTWSDANVSHVAINDLGLKRKKNRKQIVTHIANLESDIGQVFKQRKSDLLDITETIMSSNIEDNKKEEILKLIYR